ncbi:MAG: glycoside hydrolase family 10 protein [Salinibacter sp.]|uniref:glycoside hydrolase family 10 protein n=1 Tax=Salinibacter sp. TaxID=2065818 RepID=UPI0035D48456
MLRSRASSLTAASAAHRFCYRRLALRLLIFGIVLSTGCRTLGPQQSSGWAKAEATSLPSVSREFRAAWIATVANIDWPSEPGLPVEQQKAELRRMLDQAAALHLNAVIFQVRPHADALYDSPHEPWSFYLTGKQGRAPDPHYDPLRFAVREAHERGLELHAWFNPFRAGHPADTSALAPNHVSHTHPKWVRQYGEYLWLDPGVPEARAHTRRVIMDVVRRYEIDGVHFDDYFYPYPSYADGAPFPDSASWARAQRNGWTGSRADWRRHNVNRLVKRLYRSVKEADPQVKFGISPFGIWRPGHPPGTKGFDAYAQLYADARKWLREGWIDYITPQLYYRTDQYGYAYPTMLRWWIEQNRHDRHVWPGLYTSRVRMSGNRHWSDRHLIGQIYTARSHPEATGQVHFSMQALMPLPDSVLVHAGTDSAAVAPVLDTVRADSVIVAGRPVDSVAGDAASVDSIAVPQTRRGPRHLRATARLLERLPTEPYAEPALVPASPWLNDEPPKRPILTVWEQADHLILTMKPTGQQTVRWWVVRWRRGSEWVTDIVPGPQRTYQLARDPSTMGPSIVAVSAVDRAGAESAAMVLRRRGSRSSRPAPTNR